MGRVYRARRADGAYDRTVALKVVRASLSLAGSDVAARLRRERDLLAALDHAGIARLVDGGETEDGVPYLVTEFVDGVPITAYADAHGLSVAARVRLMVGVCRAVEHAHRRLVVHRDLKPSNVLVTEADGAPHAVVLDFDIAKLLDVAGEASGGTAGDFPLTRTGMRLLTPAYAAPELFDAAATVTTAADVYGLGTLLYELLTGRRPHPDLDGTSGGATREPVRPSRVLTETAGAAGAADTRQVRRVRGDLDTIALRALAPDPARRYPSAAALADDLERHLEGRPVLARPDSVGYVARLFVRRHRGAVAGAAVALVALVAGLGASLVLLAQARSSRTEAEAQAERATIANDFAAGLFKAEDPFGTGRADVSVREMLAAGCVRAGEFGWAPARQADLLGLLAAGYANLGEGETADTLYRAALAVAPDPDGPDSATLRVGLADLLSENDAPDEAIPLYRSVAAQPGIVPHVQQGAQIGLASTLAMMGETDDALGILDRTTTAARAARDSMGLANILNNRAFVLRDAMRPADAFVDFDESLRITRRLYGANSRWTAGMLGNVAHALMNEGRGDEAIATFLQAHRVNQRLYPPGHPALVLDLASLGRAEGQRKRPAAAVPYLESAVAQMRRTFPADSPELTDAVRRLAIAYGDVGRCAEAEPLARGRRAEGTEHVQVALDSMQHNPFMADGVKARVRTFLPPGVRPRG